MFVLLAVIVLGTLSVAYTLWLFLLPFSAPYELHSPSMILLRGTILSSAWCCLALTGSTVANLAYQKFHPRPIIDGDIEAAAVRDAAAAKQLLHGGSGADSFSGRLGPRRNEILPRFFSAASSDTIGCNIHPHSISVSAPQAISLAPCCLRDPGGFDTRTHNTGSDPTKLHKNALPS
ncbi:hypothetical protein U1Q18_026317 [Sarracenia purpurea var. burkii]